MKQLTVLLLALGIGSSARAENRTDTSLFMKSDSSTYQTGIRSTSGDLYLLKVPPDRTGRIPDFLVRRLEEIGKRLQEKKKE